MSKLNFCVREHRKTSTLSSSHISYCYANLLIMKLKLHCKELALLFVAKLVANIVVS